MSQPPTQFHRFLHHPLVGTNVSVLIDGRVDRRRADSIDAAIVDEMVRLESIFTIFDDASELERWKRGDLSTPSPEFVEVMGGARSWWEASRGAFDPRTGLLTRLWTQAAQNGSPPAQADIDAVLEQLATPGYEMIDGRPVVTGDVSGFQLHAFAKGWIVDRALAVGIDAADGDAPNIAVNAGGDLAHQGPDPQLVGIEDPFRTFDNQPPVARVRVTNAGLATSGRARQGFDVGHQRYSHVIDPRRGVPVDELASISVVAPTAATADVIATIAGVERPERAVEVADRWDVALLVIGADGEMFTNTAWQQIAARRE